MIKMNKLDRIKNLENELAELKADIVEEEKVKKEWNPKGNNYILTNTGGIVQQESVERCVNYGVTFETSYQAQQAAIAYRRYHRLYRLALELNDGWVPDWDDNDQYKWCIRYNRLLDSLFADYSYWTYGVLDIIFETKELAQKAIDILGDELL